MMDGHLKLLRCRHVRIQGFHFEQSWPTHIALDDCQQIEIAKCTFLDATFAIGATGRSTRGLTIEDCSWTQDRVLNRIWREIPWYRIHGAPENDPPEDEDDPLVDIENDWRLFDGDFFRADGITGDVTIRGCRIERCFNAIHLFNDDSDLALARDVHVHDCTFVEVRDNVLEPEKVASNWWFHHNKLFNVHKWFSFECVRSKHFYLFGNLAWFDSIQGPSRDDGNRGGGVFKLAKIVHRPFGPHYVFHNSFSTRSDYARKGIFPGLMHFNNAIRCADQAGPDFNRYPNFFGDLSATGPEHQRKRFTMDWDQYHIEMRNDVVRHPDWPDGLNRAGYSIGGPPLGVDPRFLDPFGADLSGGGLMLETGSPCEAMNSAETILLPDGGSWPLVNGQDIGAWQGERLVEGPGYQPTVQPIA
jgi:hypothetical protein